MGCFSYMCNGCGKPIRSSSFGGDVCELALLSQGKIQEKMYGKYDSYGRVFNGARRVYIRGDGVEIQNESSFQWEVEDWSDIVDIHFNNTDDGIVAHCSECIRKGNTDYSIRSEDDPEQGWGKGPYLKGRGALVPVHTIIR